METPFDAMASSEILCQVRGFYEFQMETKKIQKTM
jgi:hypothetical protein